jgi:transcriptional regulator of arginine metabolism
MDIKMVKKVSRLEAIKELIKNQPIEDQQTLVSLIKSTYGIETNQSIVSRDLRAMGVTKRSVGNKLIYELEEVDASREILRLAVVDVEHNESLVVVKTLPGLAAFVGDILDMHDELGIMGTIAGENTLFVAPKKVKDIENTFNEICKVLYVKTLR